MVKSRSLCCQGWFIGAMWPVLGTNQVPKAYTACPHVFRLLLEVTQLERIRNSSVRSLRVVVAIKQERSRAGAPRILRNPLTLVHCLLNFYDKGYLPGQRLPKLWFRYTWPGSDKHWQPVKIWLIPGQSIVMAFDTNIDVVGRASTSDVKLGDSNFWGSSTGKGIQSCERLLVFLQWTRGRRVLIQQHQHHHQRPGGFGSLETDQSLFTAGIMYYDRDLTDSIDWNTSSKPRLDVADHTVHLGIWGGIQTFKVRTHKFPAEQRVTTHL